VTVSAPQPVNINGSTRISRIDAKTAANFLGLVIFDIFLRGAVG